MDLNDYTMKRCSGVTSDCCILLNQTFVFALNSVTLTSISDRCHWSRRVARDDAMFTHALILCHHALCQRLAWLSVVGSTKTHSLEKTTAIVTTSISLTVISCWNQSARNLELNHAKHGNTGHETQTWNRHIWVKFWHSTLRITVYKLLSHCTFKDGLHRIQILCRSHPFWSYLAGLTIADPPG